MAVDFGRLLRDIAAAPSLAAGVASLVAAIRAEAVSGDSALEKVVTIADRVAGEAESVAAALAANTPNQAPGPVPAP